VCPSLVVALVSCHNISCRGCRFCYAAYNSPKFNGFINCTFWSIIVVITLGKCAYRTPSGVWERHTCIRLFSSKKKICKKHLFQSWTSERWTCVNWISCSRIWMSAVVYSFCIYSIQSQWNLRVCVFTLSLHLLCDLSRKFPWFLAVMFYLYGLASKRKFVPKIIKYANKIIQKLNKIILPGGFEQLLKGPCHKIFIEC
jgi:hypothetical protein